MAHVQLLFGITGYAKLNTHDKILVVFCIILSYHIIYLLLPE